VIKGRLEGYRDEREVTGSTYCSVTRRAQQVGQGWVEEEQESMHEM